jgi:hypothetical protein
MSETGLPGAATEEARFSLPSYPGDRPPLFGWLVVREEGGVRHSSFLPPGAQWAELRVDKNLPAPVLFFPLAVLSDSPPDAQSAVRFFKPAGCVYPASLQATWPGGFCAQVCMDILTNPGDPASLRALCNGFNWRRFQEEVASLTAAEETVNPWEMDIVKISAAIVGGKFTKTALKPAAKTVTVAEGTTLPAPNSLLFQSYVPSPPLDISPILNTAPLNDPSSPRGAAGLTFAWCPGNELVFDGRSVFLVNSGQTGYRLALMPIKAYTWEQ